MIATLVDMTPARADAIRSRTRILDAARGCSSPDLRLNEVARRAGVGVGTVYRHFPTTEALAAALASDVLIRLRDLAQAAAHDDDPAIALTRLVRGGLELQLGNAGLQTALLADDDNLADLGIVRGALIDAVREVLDRAVAVGAVRADLTLERLQHLMCGIEYAARLQPADDADFYLDAALAAIRPLSV